MTAPQFLKPSIRARLPALNILASPINSSVAEKGSNFLKIFTFFVSTRINGVAQATIISNRVDSAGTDSLHSRPENRAHSRHSPVAPLLQGSPLLHGCAYTLLYM